MHSWYLWYIDFAKDIYWCFIPWKCRRCQFLSICRKGFLKFRRRRGICIMQHYEEYKKKEKQEKEDYINGLLAYIEEQEKNGTLGGSR